MVPLTLKKFVISHYHVTILFGQGNKMQADKLEMARTVEMAGLNKMRLYKMETEIEGGFSNLAISQ